MKNKDEDVKNALDEIFGDDFLEIEVPNNKKEDAPLIDKAVFTDYELEEEKEESKNENNVNINSDIFIEEPKIEEEQKELEQPEEIIISNTTNEVTKTNEDKKIKNLSIKKVNIKLILTVIVIIFVCILLGVTIYLSVFGIRKTEVCSMSAEDDGYKFTDEYVITYKKNNIEKIKSTYSYVAYTGEYINQIEAIKKDKLPVIINSNGMSGFTYILEEKNDMIKITGYLDFSIMNFDKVDKQNQKLFPLSYETFDSKTTVNNYKKKLKKDGFICNIKK